MLRLQVTAPGHLIFKSVVVLLIGEIIGGSQREDKLEVLEARMEELGMRKEDYGFYLDLRRYGSSDPARPQAP